MSKRKIKSGVYTYLDSCGVLEHGTGDAIAQARRKYWQDYKARWRKQKRQAEKELTTSWATDELKDLTKAAKLHNMSRVSYIKSATLAYTTKVYLVPDKTEVRKIVQLLNMNYNLIQEMIEEKALHLQTGKIILERILELERVVFVSLHSPKTIDHIVTEAVAKNPAAKANLYQLLESLP
ncbi:MAG: hypothetical protein M0Q26_13465 [Chitinophagaceae bacterium]|nr:hypothetical protein [Chitinophagaceae bacterium]